MFTIVDINVEFSLNRVMHLHAGANVHLAYFSVPVSLESDWYSFPSVRINMSESITTNSDNSLSQNIRLLTQMHMMFSRIVKPARLSRSHKRNSVQFSDSLNFNK